MYIYEMKKIKQKLNRKVILQHSAVSTQEREKNWFLLRRSSCSRNFLVPRHWRKRWWLTTPFSLKTRTGPESMDQIPPNLDIRVARWQTKQRRIFSQSQSVEAPLQIMKPRVLGSALSSLKMHDRTESVRPGFTKPWYSSRPWTDQTEIIFFTKPSVKCWGAGATAIHETMCVSTLFVSLFVMWFEEKIYSK